MLQFYRIQTFGNNQPYLAKTSTTLQHLILQLKQNQIHNNFDIYYHWKPLSIQKFGKLTLKQIVHEDPMQQPIFYIYNHIQVQGICPIRMRYGDGIIKIANTDQKPRQYWIGSNDHILFDTRKNAILASAVTHASNNEQYIKTNQITKKNFQNSIIQQNTEPITSKKGLLSRFFSKIGIISKQPSYRNIQKTIDTLKNIQNKQQLQKHIDRQYSDYDPKFATYLESIYIKFALLSAFRIHYVEYKKIEQGIIPYYFPKNTKIGIIGDYGTGLSDSIQLLRDLVINRGADIILHLGDVYYAGTPHQYENNVILILQQLRIKTKKQILFYSIPGNHDYYSWGLPFLCFLKQVNSDTFAKQISSYFCLRSEDNSWQFIGLDTAYHDSNPTNQINGVSIGPSIRKRQLQWFTDKMESFPGSTILLTHHQLFSIHQRICGSFSSYRHFSCINPLLSGQLFEYIPHISAWFWGHQHSYMLFDDHISGTNKCRLLGNSSFHVFEKQNPYIRKNGFPIIPFIEQDQKYYKKYLPVHPKSKNNLQSLYNLCYSIIDFSKADKHHLPIEYYCCPSYCPQEKKNRNFKPYLIYKENISQRSIKEDFVETNTNLQIKTELGLCIAKGNMLSLGGTYFRIKQTNSLQNIRIFDGDQISIQGVQDESCYFMNKRFIINKKIVLNDKYAQIKYRDSFTLQQKYSNKYLCCQIGIDGPYLTINNQQNHQSLFMFIKQSKIKDISDAYQNHVINKKDQ